jgi:hydrogenase maturation protease
MSTKLVLGIGNTLLCDEGCGVHVVHYLQRHYGQTRPDVCFLDGGSLSFTLASYIDDTTQLIVVDAAELHAKPGAIRTFLDAHMDTFLGNSKHSAHDVGLLDLLDIARLTHHFPSKRALVAIQPQQITWGDKPSRAVATAIPKAAERVLELIHD